jgi:cytochrome bd-type quinol oxidase subunit 2
MSYLIFILAALVVVVLIVGVAFKGKTEGAALPYKAKQVMSEVEQTLFFRLVDALPEYVVLAQVQLSSFLKVTTNGKSRQAAFNRIAMKSVDFLVCKKDFSVLAGVELQDNTHNRADRQRNDEFKRAAFEVAGLQLVEFRARNLPTLEEIKAAIVPKVTIEGGTA